MDTSLPAAEAAGWNWLAALADQGWAVSDTAMPQALALALAAAARARHAEGALQPAGIGRADDHQIARTIRSDRTLWLGRRCAIEIAYLDWMEALRLHLNRSLFLGLFAYEAHYAAYEPGGFYARHLDAFKGSRNRIVSTVLYLNTGWQAGDGGALAIYPAGEAAAHPGEAAVARLWPELGRLVLFLSEDIPHEVLPARRTRYSIAGWFRLNDRAEAPVLQAPVLPLPPSGT